MPVSRKERIEAMLADDPQDAFLRYSLAMELDKEGQAEASLAQFDGLMGDAVPYVPAFFMAAQLQVRLQRIEPARALLRRGIEEARRQGNAHAAGEMSELLTSLGYQGA